MEDFLIRQWQLFEPAQQEVAGQRVQAHPVLLLGRDHDRRFLRQLVEIRRRHRTAGHCFAQLHAHAFEDRYPDQELGDRRRQAGNQRLHEIVFYITPPAGQGCNRRGQVGRALDGGRRELQAYRPAFDGVVQSRAVVEIYPVPEPGFEDRARDAVKKEALRKAGIGYHEVPAGETTPRDLRALVERLVPPPDNDN